MRPKQNRPRPCRQVRAGRTVRWTDASPCPISSPSAGLLPGDNLSESAGETVGAGGEVTCWDRVCQVPCQVLNLYQFTAQVGRGVWALESQGLGVHLDSSIF